MKPISTATPATEPGADGHLIGRDPRQLSPDQLAAAGHKPMSAQEALRARCIDCCSGSADEVRKCVAVRCPAWPFRMGRSPWKAKRTLTPEHLAKLQAGRLEGKQEAV
jgi:hypothetical protein